MKFKEREHVYYFDLEESIAGSHATIRSGIIGKGFRTMFYPSELGRKHFYEVMVNVKEVSGKMLLANYARDNKPSSINLDKIESRFIGEDDLFTTREEAIEAVDKYISHVSKSLPGVHDGWKYTHKISGSDISVNLKKGTSGRYYRGRIK